MNKKTLVLGGIFAVLLALAFLYEPFLEWKDNLGKPNNIFESLNFSDVNRISIDKEEKSVSLEKTGDKWKISGTKEFYVSDNDLASIKSGLENVSKAEVEVISENSDKKAELGTGDSGAKVKLMQNEDLLFEFIVGKIGPDYSSTYISLPGEDKTFLYSANLSGVFNRTDFYDRVIFQSEKEKISKLRFQYPNREFEVEKGKEGDWSGSTPYYFRVDEEKIDDILDLMSSLSASDIPSQTFEGSGLEKNLQIIQAIGDEIDNTLMVGEWNGDKDKPLYYAKKGDSDNIYLISEQERDTLDKTIRDLR